MLWASSAVNPINGITGRCARAASGHVIVELTKSRRRIAFPKGSGWLHRSGSSWIRYGS
jgi:hypothetical protein